MEEIATEQLDLREHPIALIRIHKNRKIMIRLEPVARRLMRQ